MKEKIEKKVKGSTERTRERRATGWRETSKVLEGKIRREAAKRRRLKGRNSIGKA